MSRNGARQCLESEFHSSSGNPAKQRRESVSQRDEKAAQKREKICQMPPGYDRLNREPCTKITIFIHTEGT